MSFDLTRSGVTVGAFMVLFATGYWLARLGKPYGFALFNVHKLVAVGILIFVAVVAYGANKTAPLGMVVWICLAVAAVGFLVLMGTGGAMSAMNAAPQAVRVAHKMAPYVTTVLTLTALFMLGRGKA